MTNTTTACNSTRVSWERKTFRSRSWDIPADEVYERQDRLTGFDSDLLRRTTLLGVGAGGLGSFVYPAIARKGVGRLVIADADLVEVSNLNRQHFFRRDLYCPKAFALAKHSVAHSILGCRADGHRTDFDAGSATALSESINLAYVGVDNDQTRAFASRHFREHAIPAVFAGVSADANYGYVFLQRAESEAPCLGCVFSSAMERAQREPRRCRSTPAAVDILQSVGALALFAVDALLMQRECHWNFRDLSLAGGESRALLATKVPSCPLCGEHRGNLLPASSFEASNKHRDV